MVAPFTGAWIEISDIIREETFALWSHPSRVRGLKFVVSISKLRKE